MIKIIKLLINFIFDFLSADIGLLFLQVDSHCLLRTNKSYKQRYDFYLHIQLFYNQLILIIIEMFGLD